MKIAVVGNFEGCKLNKLYEEIEQIEAKGNSIDLVLICGNFQAIRNKNDLKCVDCLDCWKNMGDFEKYYNGKLKAKHLTLVVGGSEEVSNFFKTLPYGGWLAPNIYYMGNSNVIKFNGVRIGGISGTSDKIFDHIYKTDITSAGYFERLPFDSRDRRSVCYTRNLDVNRMLQVTGNLDIMFTFDWPLGVLGDKQVTMNYMKKIPFPFQNGDLFNDLGNLMYKDVLDRIKPKHWFAGKVRLTLNEAYKHSSNEATLFHSLNKYGQSKKENLQVFDIDSDPSNKNGLEYDLEWLSILKATNQYVSIERTPTNQPTESDDNLKLEHKKSITFSLGELKILKNYNKCSPVVTFGIDRDPQRTKNYTNKQTTRFCKKFQLTDPNQLIVDQTKNRKFKCTKNTFKTKLIGWCSKLRDTHQK